MTTLTHSDPRIEAILASAERQIEADWNENSRYTLRTLVDVRMYLRDAGRYAKYRAEMDARENEPVSRELIRELTYGTEYGAEVID
jgi:hypothetical protein